MSETIPNNLCEVVQELDKSLSQDDKEYLLEHGALSVHNSLGRWIRNNWGLWDEEDNKLKAKLKKLGFEHPDDMSNYIIKVYIEYLKNERLLWRRKNYLSL